MTSLTFDALNQLNHLNSQIPGLSVSTPISISQEEKWETASDCSYYSLPELVKDKWYRRIPASQVRDQAKQIADRPAVSESKYPRNFHNIEGLPLQASGPWKEYPFCLNKPYVFGSPGPVRMITNSHAPGNFDVVYHPGRLDRSAALAKYRPKGYSKGAIPKPLPPSTPSSPTPSYSSLGSPATSFSDVNNPYQQWVPVTHEFVIQHQQALAANNYMLNQVMGPGIFPPPGFYPCYPNYTEYSY